MVAEVGSSSVSVANPIELSAATADVAAPSPQTLDPLASHQIRLEVRCSSKSPEKVPATTALGTGAPQSSWTQALANAPSAARSGVAAPVR